MHLEDTNLLSHLVVICDGGHYYGSHGGDHELGVGHETERCSHYGMLKHVEGSG